MENITYGQSNEVAGHIYTRVIHVNKAIKRYIKYSYAVLTLEGESRRQNIQI